MLVLRWMLLISPPQRSSEVCVCVQAQRCLCSLSVSMCVCKRETKDLPSFTNTLMCGYCLCLYWKPTEWRIQAGSAPMWVSESTSQAWGHNRSPQVCHPGAPCWHGAPGRWRLRWALSYILTQLLSSQGTFLDQNPWERGGTKCNVLAFYKWRSGIWPLISFLVTVLSETWGPLQQFPEHNGAFLHLPWDQTLLLIY